ncbi:hypothetical protein ACJ41O_013694 [Fusarium nematophilum]
MGHSPIVPGRAELATADTPDHSNEPTSTSAPDVSSSSSNGNNSSSGYDSNVSSSEKESVCNKVCKKDKCSKRKCAKTKCVKNGGHGKHKQVSSSDGDTSDNAATTESSGDQKAPAKGNKTKARKDKAVSSTEDSSNATTAENDTSAETDEASADANTGADSSSASNSEANTKASEKSNNSTWSISEDCLLRGMKEGDQGATWADIAAALNKSKKEVRARWNIIKNQLPTDSEPSNGASTTADEAGNDTNPDTNDTGVDEEGKNDEEHGGDKPMAEEKGKGKATSPVRNKWHNGVRNDKVAAENKKAKAKAKAKTTVEKESSGDEASSESSEVTSSDSSSDFGYGDQEKRQERRYLQDHIYQELYPADIHPRPDGYFSKRDCELLAAIDSKYKRSRWLEMQANFYNVTGRMVPLEAIRAKCEREEQERAERKANRELERRLGSVERWVKKVSREELEDPES